jgi:hypothetical protein
LLKRGTIGAMQRLAAILVPTVALLAACAVPPPDVPEAPPPPVFAQGECDAQGAQAAIGQAYNQPLGEQARTRSGAERVRALRPGDMTTMEFNARRLTIDVDAAGKVAGVRCG